MIVKDLEGLLRCGAGNSVFCQVNLTAQRNEVVDHDFERMVQEGLAALKKSRELLKNDRDMPPDWKEIPPGSLKLK